VAAIQRVILVCRSIRAVLSDQDSLRQRTTGGKELAEPPQQQHAAADKGAKPPARVEWLAGAERLAERNGWVRDRKGTWQHRDLLHGPSLRRRVQRASCLFSTEFSRRYEAGGECGQA
jgi:hypothetical protein